MATNLKKDVRVNRLVELVRSGEEEPKAKNRSLMRGQNSVGNETNHLEHFGITLRDANLELIVLDLERLQFKNERLALKREKQEKKRVGRRNECKTQKQLDHEKFKLF